MKKLARKSKRHLDAVEMAAVEEAAVIELLLR